MNDIGTLTKLVGPDGNNHDLTHNVTFPSPGFHYHDMVTMVTCQDTLRVGTPCRTSICSRTPHPHQTHNNSSIFCHIWNLANLFWGKLRFFARHVEPFHQHHETLKTGKVMAVCVKLPCGCAPQAISFAIVGIRQKVFGQCCISLQFSSSHLNSTLKFSKSQRSWLHTCVKLQPLTPTAAGRLLWSVHEPFLA